MLQAVPPLHLDDVKATHRAMWSSGDYAAVADAVIPRLGETLVRACPPAPGAAVLDLACGSGIATLPAARRGARVTGVDLCDLLLQTCTERATGEGLDVTCTPADVEALPFPDAAFDTVLSCVGIMFAPDHRQAADEMLRVCRPGGTIGLLNWTPTGFVGQLLTALRPFLPAPAPGAQPPVRWGEPEYVRDLAGDRVGRMTVQTGHARVACFEQPTDFRRLFAGSYGPTLVAYTRLRQDPARVEELDSVLEDLARRHWRADNTMEWEYVIVCATRRDESEPHDGADHAP